METGTFELTEVLLKLTKEHPIWPTDTPKLNQSIESREPPFKNEFNNGYTSLSVTNIGIDWVFVAET